MASREHPTFTGPQLELTMIPEPSTLGLFALGLLGIGFRRLRRRG